LGPSPNVAGVNEGQEKRPIGFRREASCSQIAPYRAYASIRVE